MRCGVRRRFKIWPEFCSHAQNRTPKSHLPSETCASIMSIRRAPGAEGVNVWTSEELRARRCTSVASVIAQMQRIGLSTTCVSKQL